jgi:acetylornithine/succinyldiaminopimelate/putrescine aminotransferase
MNLLERCLGGPAFSSAMRAGLEYLDTTPRDMLFGRIGKEITDLPVVKVASRDALSASYAAKARDGEDFLVGRGMFYLTENRKLCLDCTSGHYQMLLGYQPPEMTRIVAEALELGVVWDNHANIAQGPVKRLAKALVAAANWGGSAEPSLDRVLLGCCTGSVACESALKMQLNYFETRRGTDAKPAVVVLEGNYHGTNMIPQFLRGQWSKFVRNIEVVSVEPNDPAELEAVFTARAGRVAAFWAEPVLMNREAIPVEASYLRLARELCDRAEAVMCVDEIQTGFWQPDVFAFGKADIVPDMVIAGKGMTAGVHPLAAVLCRNRYDLLGQYDAINTNGSAPLAAFAALYVLETIRENREEIVRLGDLYFEGLQSLAADFPNILTDVRGVRHLAGLKFKEVDTALAFHRRLLDAGLWTRVHAYHAGHSTVLTKLPLIADEGVVEYVVGRLRELLGEV